MLKKTILVRSLAVAFGGAAVIAAMPAMAQQAAEPNVQRVVVTGSLISRADKETPSPVQVLSAEDLAKSGYTSVAEVLSNLASNGQGALASGFSGAFANGGAGVSLRGLSVGLTLVLIDGHRMAPYPLADDAQRQFVDISSIPFEAVDRIEVLKDGASAVYGSDAVSGVVNVILKKTYNGTIVKVDGGNSQHGGGKNVKVSLTHGFGDLANDGYNAFGSIEYRHADAIKVYQRDGYNWADGNWSDDSGVDLRRGVPTVANNFLVAPSTPFLYNAAGAKVNGSAANNPANFQFLDANCNFDKYRAGGCMVRDMVSNLQPESHNVNMVAGFTKTLGEDWTLALKASMFRRNSVNNRGVPLTFSPTSFTGFTSLVPGQNPQIVNVIGATPIPAASPLNKLGAPARLYGYVPGIDPANTQDNTSTATRFVADLNGSAFGWDISAAAGMTKVKVDREFSGYIDRVALYQAVSALTNPFNPLGGNSQAAIDKVSPRFSNTSDQTLNFLEVHGQREIAKLGEGTLNFATGASWTRKKLDAMPPDLLAKGVVGNGAAYAFGTETDTAIFGEVVATPLRTVELSASARYDHYDTYGNSFTPGAKFKWAVAPMATIRGTFAKGFRAPNQAEVGTASSFFSFHAINDPILCADGNPKTKGNVPTSCQFTPAFVQVTSKDLSPEKSKSYTLGLILEPSKNLNAALDYYSIEVKDQINTAAGLPGFVPTYVRNAIVPTEISNGDGTTSQGTPSVGTIAYGTSGYVNTGSTKTTGFEMDLSYRMNLGDAGKLKANLSFNHMISYKIESNGVTYELAGTHGPSVVSGDTGNPKNRAQFTLGWDKGPLTTTATFNWVGSFSNLDPSVDVLDCKDVAAGVSGRTYFFANPNNPNGETPAKYCRTASFVSTDLNVSYKVNKNLTIRGSILNLFDRQPPIDVATYGNANNLTAYNATLHQAGAVGRFFSLGANYQF